jgi:hypothetical protein
MRKILERVKKIVLGLFVLMALFALPKNIKASENCTTYYGQGVVCGAETPEEFVHQPVEAGFETNIRVLGLGLIFLSAGVYFASKKLRPKAEVFLDLR